MFVFQFDHRKTGDNSKSGSFRGEFELQLSDLQLSLHAMIDYLEKRIQVYSLTMEKSINERKIYYSNDDLMNLHQKLKNDILTQIQMQADTGNFRRIVRVCMIISFKMKINK